MKRIALWIPVLALALAGCGRGAQPVPGETPPPSELSASMEGADDQGMIDPGGTLVVRFSEPMSPTSARPPVTASPRVALRTSWSGDYRSLTIGPQQYFKPGEEIVLTLGKNMRSASGQVFPAPPVWTVLVRDAPQLVKRPTVSLTAGGRALVTAMEFTLAMDPASVETCLSVEPDLPLRLTWKGTSLTIDSTSMPQPSTTYDFLLRREAQDLQGRLLVEDIRWTYRTPSLTGTHTLPGRDNPDSAITLRFNYALDAASAREAFYIDPLVAGEVSFDGGGTLLTFTPDAPLSFGGTYEVGFRDPVPAASGDPLPPIAPQQFSIPGPVAAVSPADYEIVEPPQTVRVSFTRPMDEASVEAAFTIQPAIDGSLRWERNTLVFAPIAGRLAESTDYAVALGPGMTTADGTQPLPHGYRWSFQTTETPRVVQFNSYGANLRMVEPGREIPVGYWTRGNVSAPISFSLFRLTAEEFADHYAHHYEPYQWGEERESIPVRGASLDRSWVVDTGPSCPDTECTAKTQIPGRLNSGLYLLQVSALGATDEILLVASSWRVTAKTHAGQVVAWVTDGYGNPKSGIDVQVGITNGQLVSGGETDTVGLYDTWVFGPDGPVLVIASKGDQVAITGLDSSWDSIAARGCGSGYGWWGEPWDTSRGPVRLLAHIHTDRPIYRPGQTVYYKAILRQDEDALVSLLPDGTPVTVEVLDTRRNILQTEILETNAFGTVDGSFNLADGAMLGTYAVQIRVNDDAFHQAFAVEDYRKPDYEVRLTLDKDQYVSGDTMLVTLEAEYFLGQPVTGATVELIRYRVFSWWGWETGDDPGYTEALDFEPAPLGKTDERGRLTFEVPTANLSDWYWREGWFHRDVIGLEVTLDDGSHQSVSAFVGTPVYSAAERIRLLVDTYSHRRGETFPLRATVTDLQGAPVAGRVLTWSLNRYDSDTFESMSETGAEFTTDEKGIARTDVVFTRSGWYEVTVQGEDPQGNSQTASRWFYIGGTQQRTRPGSSLEVYADRDSYAPGDTAHLIIESSYGGPALLTFERASVRRQQVIELTPPVTELDVPVRTDDVPNVFVEVSTWGPPGDWWYGEPFPGDVLETASVELTVPAEGKELRVEASADKTTYGPGETAEFTLEVTDSAGQPVAAELSLSLVDEAIYSLSDDLSPPLLRTFYARRPHLVDTYDSLGPMLAMYADGCGGGGGGGGGLPGNPRSDFPDTAIWLPAVLTGSDGVARVRVTLPDSLTTWRLTVRAVTRDSKVGETTTHIVTQLPLAIRSLLPRQLTQGDTATLAAAVHNGSDLPQTARIRLAGTSIRVLDSQMQQVEIQPGESLILTWSVEVTQPGEAVITMTAESDQARDSIQVTLPSLPLSVREVFATSGSTLDSVDFTFLVPQDAETSSTIRLNLSRDATQSLLDGLEYLTGYPYGCVEQVMSAALPNAVIARAFGTLGILDADFEGELSSRIRDGLQRLYSLQHSDGGWGWWYDDETDAYQTAWVMFGLAVTQRAGYGVDAGVVDRAANWLLSELPTMDPRTRAFALYALSEAGRGQPDQSLRLADSAQQLDPFALAAVALALERDGERQAAQALLEILKARVQETDGEAHFAIYGADGEYNDKTMASEIRSTALGLTALVRIEGDQSPLVGKIVPWLMAQRRAYGWGTTNETSFAILGLTDHMLASKKLAGDLAFTTKVDGRSVSTGTLTAENPSVEVDLPFESVGPGEHTLRVVSESRVRLYYRLTIDARIPRSQVDAAGVVEVARAYLDPATLKPLETIEPGQVVAVRLTVRLPERASYMIVEDRLPSGLEALNERLNTTSRGTSEYEEIEGYGPAYYWQEYGYNYKEIRAGRVSFFITEMGPGAHSFIYLTRATYPGFYTALPAEAYAMYDVETWGRSETSQVLIGPQAATQADAEGAPPAP